MSELLDQYTSQLPERCLADCPVASACVAAARAYEEDAIDATEAMLELEQEEPFDEPIENAVYRTIRSLLLDVSMTGEQGAMRMMARLAESGGECPTPRRGGVPNEVLLSRIISWLEGNRVCQNPGRDQLLKP